MNIPFLSKLTSLLVLGGFCLSPLGLAGGGVVAGGIIVLLAALNAAERGRASQEGTAAGQVGALAQGVFSLTVWPFYLCVMGLLLWVMNEREHPPMPVQVARRELAGGQAAAAMVPTQAGTRATGPARPANPQISGGPGPAGAVPKPRPLMSTLTNRAAPATGSPARKPPVMGPVQAGSPAAGGAQARPNVPGRPATLPGPVPAASPQPTPAASPQGQ